MLYVADIKKFGKLQYEISELIFVDNLTYPDIQPKFIEELKRRKAWKLK